MQQVNCSWHTIFDPTTMKPLFFTLFPVAFLSFTFLVYHLHSFLSQKLVQGSSADFHLHCFVKKNASCLYFEDRTTSHLPISAVSENADLFYELSVGVRHQPESADWSASATKLKMTLIPQQEVEGCESSETLFCCTVRFFQCSSSPDISNTDLLIKSTWDALAMFAVLITVHSNTGHNTGFISQCSIVLFWKGNTDIRP